jgi:tetratricopeptide (TPR) repeat protein
VTKRWTTGRERTVRYGGTMAASRSTFPSRARQWSRAAWGLALLFASLPIAGWLFLGGFGFPGAGELSGICFLLGLYLHIRSRKTSPIPDAAAMLEESIGLSAGGQAEQAIALLTKTIRLNPHLWQAFQHRGSLHLRGNALHRAIEDFTAAIRLAPEEAHLYALRGQALGFLGDDRAAYKDYETAIALGGGNNLRANG